MPPYFSRPAIGSDAPRIKALVLQVRITAGLDWQRFLIAETPAGELAGCGQVKPHRDGSRELASIATAPQWRGQGVARAIIEKLIEAHPGPLYLTCRARLGPFYDQFGFRAIMDPEALPAYFRRVLRLARSLGWMKLIPRDLLVMQRDSN
jgi:N-acetylglutamate synthase-like GNAT family acetyltransferase